MASSLLRRLQSSQIRRRLVSLLPSSQIQRRLVSSRAVVDQSPERMLLGGFVPTVPRRYVRRHHMKCVTAEDIRNNPDCLKYFVSIGAVSLTKKNKVTWNNKLGHPYLQVYSLQILSDELDQVYGTILTEWDQQIFHREFGLDNRNDIDPYGYFRLNGPDCLKWNETSINIKPKLYRGNQPGDFFHPDGGVQYCNKMERRLIPYEDIPILDRPGYSGMEIWTSRLGSEHPPNRLLIKDIKTTCGTFRLAFAIFTDAADSYLTIKLLKWKGQGNCANIYGRVYASNTRLDDERAKSLVFDRNRDEETLSVMPGHYIPLQRPNNVASMCHSLELTLSIFHKNMGSSDDHDDLELLSETFSVESKCFPRRASDVDDGITDCFQLDGKLATFEVQVYWLPYSSWY